MQPSPPLVVDVVSDVVCPWCFIGKRKLEAALAELAQSDAGVATVVRWHPFQLNPDLPAGGIARSTYVNAKFGGAAGAAEVYARIARVGHDVGIAFRFDQIGVQPNTFDAHRLIAWAQADGNAGPLVERLFNAFFIEARAIGDVASLAAIAAESGLSETAARTMLESDAMRDVVTAESREAVDVGIQGVPCMIFNGTLALSGAHDPPTLLDAIAKARTAA